MPGSAVVERTGSSGLGDVVELILDKGLVIDAFVQVSLIGIEVLTIEARVVVASVDTYLRYAQAIDRIDISGDAISMDMKERQVVVRSEAKEGES